MLAKAGGTESSRTRGLAHGFHFSVGNTTSIGRSHRNYHNGNEFQQSAVVKISPILMHRTWMEKEAYTQTRTTLHVLMGVFLLDHFRVPAVEDIFHVRHIRHPCCHIPRFRCLEIADQR